MPVKCRQSPVIFQLPANLPSPSSSDIFEARSNTLAGKGGHQVISSPNSIP
ncbi:hypothetical protein PtA15_10A658 [Puccinia triticina]|uniref:Uncharacterized protein n=1 Tax=Puccinia triticina TaxID=208348 RepID=A0ABY7CVA6_9BASI|nr:uncharacterized protein PtA15_10A658 [Puccinia triticina]WAQ89234.1 hypothetical protein PtA15_10A658 [Puccinia triticina]